MGLVRYTDGSFHLLVSFVRQTPGVLDERDWHEWRYAFRVASNLLARATGGQLRFGTVTFANGALASRDADAFVFVDASGKSTAPLKASRIAGFPMILARDTRDYPAVIVHEFAHYALGLDHETTCIDEAARTCLMAVARDYFWVRDVPAQRIRTQARPPRAADGGGLFCDARNHVEWGTTEKPNPPCLDQIKSSLPHFRPTAIKDGPLPWKRVGFRYAKSTQEICVCVDGSPEQESDATRTGIKVGMNLVARLTTALEKLRLGEIRASSSRRQRRWRRSAIRLRFVWNGHKAKSYRGALEGAAGKPKGLTSALLSARSIIATRYASNGAMRTCPAVRAMIVVSDGQIKNRSRLEAAVARCIQDRIRVVALGVGKSVAHDRLREVADTAGGRYEQLLGRPSPDDMVHQVVDFFLRAICDVLEDVGIVAYRRITLPGDVDVFVDAGVRSCVVVIVTKRPEAVAAELVSEGGDRKSLERWIVRSDGFLMITLKVAKSAVANRLRLRVTRSETAQDSDVDEETIEATVAVVVRNPDVNSAVRLKEVKPPTLWVSAMRISEQTFEKVAPIKPTLRDINFLSDLQSDSEADRSSPTWLTGVLDPADRTNADLWYHSIQMGAVQLKGAVPGVNLVTVEVRAAGDIPAFTRIHRFQLVLPRGGG